MMTGILLGVIFIVAGVIAGGLAFWASAMADRELTTWEKWQPFLIFAIPAALGVLFIVWH